MPTEVLRTGIDEGELPAHLDAELAALALSGPFFYRRLITPTPLPASAAGRLVGQMLGPA